MNDGSSIPERIFLSPPDVGELERNLLLDAFDSNWVAPLGPHVDAFEKEVALYTGTTAAAALSSGTSALHLALLLMGVGPGDAVFVPTFTFIASANPVLYVGATPIFVDCDINTWTIDADALQEAVALARKAGLVPRVLIAVDIYGKCCDYETLGAICNAHQIEIIEDAAEALGASYKGRSAGSLGTVGALSFNGNKIITTGGGGMLVGDHPELLNKARHLASQARDAAPHYQHSEVGFNYRLSNLLAAVGRGQLRRLPDLIAKRRSVRERYVTALASLPGLRFDPEPETGQMNCWLTCITVDDRHFGVSRDALHSALHARNIECRPLWKPMHLQPHFEKCRRVNRGVAENLFHSGLCLPSGSSLTEEQLNRVTECIVALHRASH